ncbi:(R)-mandelonitrile lyase 1-like [Cucumis melo var. makuwa]|uniref:(R)-mandelonitrile lyase 1-like n=1 Tax=Cucumis melo var. makuwa TaxID=1194695 RepID=A0A5D3C2R2_CUCMM|nr:(R)-mandelonitrile lyase 1-like [Cucumis melo var. makuwa]
MRDRENLSQDFFSHAMRPLLEVRSYSGCIVVVYNFTRLSMILDALHRTVESWTEVDPTMVERSDVRHVADDFIDDDDEQLSSPQS